jgi:UDP-N-acetylmuramate--alanine ligase
LNAVACLGLIHQLGLDVNTAGQALGNYRGTARRFEVVGSVQGITLIDDYAHNPTKIRAALEAARSRFPGQRVWAVWQPHTYSRTQTLLDLYLNAFSQADQVLVTEIYAAREKSTGFSAAQVVERMPHAHARFTASLQDAVQTLTNELQPGDVVLVLSAGDADWINPEVLRVLNERQAQQHG